MTFSMGGIVDGWGASRERVAAWERRRTNALIELAALHEVIDDLAVSPQARDAFREGYQDLKRLPAAAVRQVIGTPYGYAWLRRVFRMLADSRRGASSLEPGGMPGSLPGPVLGITDQLLAFPVFAIGAMLATQWADDSRCSATLSLPTTIPGSARHICPSPLHPAQISVRAGELIIEHGREVTLGQVQTHGIPIIVDNRDVILGYCCDDLTLLDTSAASAEAFRLLFSDALAVLGRVVPGAETEAALIYRSVAPSLLGSPVSFPSSSRYAYGVRKFTGNFDVQCEARGISWVKCQPSSGRDRFNNVALCNYDLTVETESAILVFIHLSSLPNWRCPAKSAT